MKYSNLDYVIYIILCCASIYVLIEIVECTKLSIWVALPGVVICGLGVICSFYMFIDSIGKTPNKFKTNKYGEKIN